VPHVSVVIG